MCRCEELGITIDDLDQLDYEEEQDRDRNSNTNDSIPGFEKENFWSPPEYSYWRPPLTGHYF